MLKLAVVGVGLIGGSFALGARAAGLFSEIIGVDHNAAHLEAAQARGICDQTAARIPDDADAVLLAVPSNQTPALLVQLAQHPGLVFDVASVKGALLRKAAQMPGRFVPCHPIAGSERSGPDAARPDLFADHLVITTPHDSARLADCDTVSGWWQALGARVQSMDADEHDRLFARTSHLPHLVAFAYMQLIEQAQLPYAAGGFRDFSRIAASDPDMWAPVLRMNQTAVLAELADLQASLSAIGAAIAASDEGPLRDLLTSARERRRAFDER